LRVEIATRGPEAEQLVVVDCYMQVKIGPRVGFTTPKRATEPGRTDTLIGIQDADDAGQQVIALASICGQVPFWLIGISVGHAVRHALSNSVTDANRLSGSSSVATLATSYGPDSPPEVHVGFAALTFAQEDESRT